VLSLIFIICLSAFSKSQISNIPNQIQNNTTCAVVISWVVYDYTSCTACDNSGGNINIPAGQSGWIWTYAGTCSDPNQGCNLAITIVSIGGTNVGATYDNTNFSTNPNVFGSVGACTSSSGNFVWGGSVSAINP
jgi:hypothetical protein